jgi:HEAT repeat protein
MSRQCAAAIVLCLTAIAPSARAADDQNDQINSRLGWIQWWEANREAVLGDIAQQTSRPTTQPATRPVQLQQRVAKALIQIIKSDRGDLRAEAALALGRMEEPLAFEPLMKLTSEGDGQTRRMAWIALGLLGGSKVEKLLLESRPDESGEDAVAKVVALGFMPPTETSTSRLTAVIKQKSSSPELVRMAVWAMNARCVSPAAVKAEGPATRPAPKPPDPAQQADTLRTTMRWVIANHSSPAVVEEAMLALGEVGDEQDMRSLSLVAMGDASAKRLPAVASAVGRRDLGQTLRLRTAATFGAGKIGGKLRAALRVKRGQEFSVPLPRLDPSGKYAEDPIYPSAALIAAAQAGDMLNPLQVLNTNTVPRPGESNNPPEFVERGVAALAVGCFSRVDRGTSDPSLDLAEHLKLKREPRHLRAACALGLGLGGRPENATVLIEVARQLAPGDDMIAGHIVLGLALLRESDAALDLAKAYLKVSAQSIDVNRVLGSKLDSNAKVRRTMDEWRHLTDSQALIGRRAAMMGLAVLEDRRAAPLLVGQWGGDYYSSLEAARALNYCRAYDAADALLQLAAQNDQPHVAELAVTCLGELFDVHRPSRLSLLSNCTFYAHRVMDTGPRGTDTIDVWYHALGNRWLFERVMPTIDWH